jgi:RND family efflux transporter MFP subunit
MKMEPVYADEADATRGRPKPPGTIKINPEKQQLVGVRTGLVEKKPLRHSLRLLGKVTPDETRVFRVTAAADGWIAKVMPQVAGSSVKRDEVLATFYTPAFASAAQTLLSAMGYQDQVQTNLSPQLPIRSAIAQNNLRQYRDSLRNLGVGNPQIEELIRTRKLPEEVDLVSPADGFITARNISQGQRFERGAELYRIVDLTRVWVLADVFEKDAGLVAPDAQVTIALPGQGNTFTGTLSQTLAQFDNTTRTLKLRFEADNPDFVLKPDMFVDVDVPVSLPETLVVPADAVLDAGTRQTVFVDLGEGYFEPRLVQTGRRLGQEVQITRGLMAGERIVVSGNFLLDSESRMKLAAAGVHGEPVRDPVCGMAVDQAEAKAAARVAEHEGKAYCFCCEDCRDQFKADPVKYLDSPNEGQLAKGPPPAVVGSHAAMAAPGATHAVGAAPAVPADKVKDPVCGMVVDLVKAKAAHRTIDHQGVTYAFCNNSCREEFAADPAKYLRPAHAESDQSSMAGGTK